MHIGSGSVYPGLIIYVLLGYDYIIAEWVEIMKVLKNIRLEL